MTSHFNAEQWEIIRNSPLVVFFIVAKADGQVDSDEVEELIGLFRKPEDYGSQIFANIITEIMSNAGELEQTIAGILSSKATDFSANMTKVQQLADQVLNENESELFKNALLTLGGDIARASGDEGNLVSPEELEELAALKSHLEDLSLDERIQSNDLQDHLPFRLGNSQRDGVFAGAAVDIADGFIHFSTATQAAETAAKHFAGQVDLLLVGFPATAFGEQLKWEPSRGGQLFPHLYRSLDPHLAISVDELPVADNGVHQFPW